MYETVHDQFGVVFITRSRSSSSGGGSGGSGSTYCRGGSGVASSQDASVVAGDYVESLFVAASCSCCINLVVDSLSAPMACRCGIKNKNCARKLPVAAAAITCEHCSDLMMTNDNSRRSSDTTLDMPPPLPMKQRKHLAAMPATSAVLNLTIAAIATTRTTIRRDSFDLEFTHRVQALHIPDDSKSKVLRLTKEVLDASTVAVATSESQTENEFWKILRKADEPVVADIDECKDLVALDLATPAAVASARKEIMPMPTCIGCGMDTKMKCIWLSEREQEAFKRHPWMCLKCTVRNPIESIVPGMMDRNANMCIWFNQVTRLKAKYTEFKLLPNDEVETNVGLPDELPMLGGQSLADPDSPKGVHCAYCLPH